MDRAARWLTLLANAGVVLGLAILIIEVRQNAALTRASLEADENNQLATIELSRAAPTSAGALTKSVLAPETGVGHPTPRPGTRAFDCVGAGREDAANAVVRQRELFNRGIATADVGLIEGVLAEDVLLITGSDSELYRGRAEQLALWRNDFLNSDRLVYRRTPECVKLSPAAPLAVEYGSWRGVAAGDAMPGSAGSYTAKWRRDGSAWRLEAEVFTTDQCRGSWCPSP